LEGTALCVAGGEKRLKQSQLRRPEASGTDVNGKEPAGRRRYGMAAVPFEIAESAFVGAFRFS
jgi:hypothetical protein